MNKSVNFSPNWYSIPGNTISDILIERNISVNNFAENMGKSITYIEDLIYGNISITKDLAKDLENVLGTSRDFWISREEQYQESLKRVQLLEERVWLKELPIKEMIKFGWISNTKTLLEECLNFFQVSNIKSWNEKYAINTELLAFRTSSTYLSEQASIAAWLRRGEILTEDYDCDPWNQELFIATLEKIKSLTRKKSPKDFVPQLIDLCKKCGVAVAIVPTPSGCKASGATKFIKSDKALLLLSFRHLSDDHFWFTFFHEAGHLVLHSEKLTFIETGTQKINSEQEKEADIFAAEILVPYEFHANLQKIKGNKRNLLKMAMELGVSPGIIVGQMQYLGIIDYKYMNGYKRRYEWDEIFEL